MMSLLFNMLSSLAITFLTISWMQSVSAVILESPKLKSATASTILPSLCQEVIGTGCHDLSFLNVEF